MRRELYDMKYTREELHKRAEDALNKKDMDTYNAMAAEIKAANRKIAEIENEMVEAGDWPWA